MKLREHLLKEEETVNYQPNCTDYFVLCSKTLQNVDVSTRMWNLASQRTQSFSKESGPKMSGPMTQIKS